ncbi:MAG TPA: hypothetical protein VK041_09830, partial [Opitutales bacterium]|nr:hypothetical protein [Opitutales bacterium]
MPKFIKKLISNRDSQKGRNRPHTFFRTRTRLLVACLALLFIFSGFISLRITRQTQEAITIQLEQYYPVITALEKIRHSASRLTGAVVMQMTGREPESYSIFHQNAEILTENLNFISSLPASPDPDYERLIQRLREQVNILLSESERIISQADDRSSAAVRYSQLLSPQVLEIAETADRLSRIQRTAAQTTGEELEIQGWRA